MNENLPPEYRSVSRPGAGDLPLPDLIRSVLRAVRAHFAIVFLITAVVGGATAVLVMMQPPVYRANVTLRLGDARRALTSGIEEVSTPQERTVNPLLSQAQLLRSRTLAGQVVDSMGLRLRPDYRRFPASLLADVVVDSAAPTDTLFLRFAGDGLTVSGRGGSAEAAYGDTARLPGLAFVVKGPPPTGTGTWVVESRQAAVARLLTDLRISPRPNTNLVDVSYTAHGRAQTRDVLNAVADLYQTAEAEAVQQQSRRRREFLETQLSQTDSALVRAQQDLSDFRRQTGLYNTTGTLESTKEELADLDARRRQLSADRAVYRQLLTALTDGSAASERPGGAVDALMAAPGLLRDPVVESLVPLLIRYRASYDSLTMGRWGVPEDNPDAQRLGQLMESVKGQLVEAVQGRVDALDAQLEALASQRQSGSETMATLPGLEADELRLVQLVESLSRLGDNLREDYQKARMAEAVEVGPVEIVDRAELPLRPAARMRRLKLGLGAMLGLALGVGVALLLQMRDTSLSRPEEVEHHLHVQAIAQIPRIQPKRAIARLLSGHRSGGTAPPVLPPATDGAEAYRLLATNLSLRKSSDIMRRPLMVTSAIAGEGKSTTAANLGASFARDGFRTLLIDADLIRPSLHRIFDAALSPGLAELAVLSEPDRRPRSAAPTTESTLRQSGWVQPSAWERFLKSAIVDTGTPGLSLLPAGRGTSIPGGGDRAHGRERMAHLFEFLQGQYDVLIIDTTPVLSAADTLRIAALEVDVVFVLRAGSTGREMANHALSRLDTVDAHIVGAILTDAVGVPDYHYYGMTPAEVDAG